MRVELSIHSLSIGLLSFAAPLHAKDKSASDHLLNGIG